MDKATLEKIRARQNQLWKAMDVVVGGKAQISIPLQTTDTDQVLFQAHEDIEALLREVERLNQVIHLKDQSRERLRRRILASVPGYKFAEHVELMSCLKKLAARESWAAVDWWQTGYGRWETAQLANEGYASIVYDEQGEWYQVGITTRGQLALTADREQGA